MPCGQKCKEIIDAGAATVQTLTCMSNSVLLHAGQGGSPLPDDLVGEVRAAMEVLGGAAQNLARWCHSDGAA